MNLIKEINFGTEVFDAQLAVIAGLASGLALWEKVGSFSHKSQGRLF